MKNWLSQRIGPKEIWVSKVTGNIINEKPSDLHRWHYYKLARKTAKQAGAK